MKRVYKLFRSCPSCTTRSCTPSSAADENAEITKAVVSLPYGDVPPFPKHLMQLLKTPKLCSRELMEIPDNYKVLLCTRQCASSQFAMVPMNLMTKNGKADFVITGQWATKAQKKQLVMAKQILLLSY